MDTHTHFVLLTPRDSVGISPPFSRFGFVSYVNTHALFSSCCDACAQADQCDYQFFSSFLAHHAHTLTLCFLVVGRVIVTRLQAEHGDYDAAKHGPGTVIIASQLPQRVLEQHGLTTEEWEQRVVNAWAGQRGVEPQEAIMDYLSIAQDLEQCVD